MAYKGLVSPILEYFSSASLSSEQTAKHAKTSSHADSYEEITSTIYESGSMSKLLENRKLPSIFTNQKETK